MTSFHVSKNNFRNKFNNSSCTHPYLSHCACRGNQIPAVSRAPLRGCWRGDSCCALRTRESRLAALVPRTALTLLTCRVQRLGDGSCRVLGKPNVIAQSLERFILKLFLFNNFPLKIGFWDRWRDLPAQSLLCPMTQACPWFMLMKFYIGLVAKEDTDDLF